ncbi:hypothetical protein MMC27_000637 [Xylographa pallens]|nr:hypothetical protein [Xylographa pallens]
MPMNIPVQIVFIFLILICGAISNYETHIKNSRAIIDNDNPHTILHVPFTASSIPTFTSGTDSKVGAREVVFFYFPSALTSSDKDAIMSSVERPRPVRELSEALAVYDEWAVEGGGNKSGPSGYVVGRVDVEAHMRFHSSEEFGQNVHRLLEIKDIRYTELLHANIHAVYLGGRLLEGGSRLSEKPERSRNRRSSRCTPLRKMFNVLLGTQETSTEIDDNHIVSIRCG